jgi:hypothetical protein
MAEETVEIRLLNRRGSSIAEPFRIATSRRLAEGSLPRETGSRLENGLDTFALAVYTELTTGHRASLSNTEN